MEITFHGHSFFELVAADGTTVLTDPFLEGNPLTDRSVEDFEPDVVAVTHGDVFDHAGEAHRFDTHVICQSLMARSLQADYGHDDVRDLNVGGRYTYEGVTFLMTQGFHSIGTSDPTTDPVDFGGVAAGYVIDDGETRFYHAGDTCLFGDMRTVIGEVYRPDVAAVPIGGHHTMEADHAAIAVDWLGVEAAIPCHYNTFPDVEQDPTVFAEAVDASDAAADVSVLQSGETLEFTPGGT